MKNKFCIIIFLICIVSTKGQNYYLATPQGYGANATGGGNVTPVVVTTYIDFKNALLSTSTSNAVIIVSGTIDCLYTSVTLNNKTILGLPGARLRNNQITIGNSAQSATNSGILNIKPGSNNIIIRNLIFEGPGAYDVDGRDNLTNEGTNIWVDHCEFQDGMDGNFDNKGMADNVTVSWCKFTYLKPAIPGGSGGSNDHRFTNLVGSSSTDAPADGNYSITFQNCFWASGCKERMPRARNAQLHLLSCYYNTGISTSKAIGLGGGINNTSCYVENTNFSNINNVYTSYIGSDGGTVAINYNNCLNGVSNIGSVALPNYTTTPIPVNDVVNFLTDSTCGAGATLNITNSAVISPNICSFLNIESNSIKKFNLYPTLATDYLIFDNLFKKDALIDIYSLDGKIMETIQINSSEIEKIIFIQKYSKGIYFCKVKIENDHEIIKFIKN